jgi:thiosulfate dehydrogenase
MSNPSEKDQNVLDGLLKSIRRLGLMVAFLMATTIVMTLVAFLQPDLSSWFKKSEKEITAEKQRIQDYQNWQDEMEVKKEEKTYWHPVEISSIPPDSVSLREKIKYGEELISHTAKYLGPKGSVAPMTNGMNCQNCHLEAGTKIWGNNYGAVFATYPKYRARSGTIEDLYKRINDCMERSLNGQPLAIESKEMQAIKSYIEFIGKNAPKGEKPKGSGIVELPFLDRPADPTKGKELFVTKCQTCHMADGHGQMAPNGIEYTYPPLWGKNSYNIGAGLYRMSRFAGFIKYNMPQGATYSNPMLTDEEAWDIAAFVNSQSRPDKDIRKDWPKISEKPVDHPFGPYADPFSEEQHKFGPFQPIADLKKKNQTK